MDFSRIFEICISNCRILRIGWNYSEYWFESLELFNPIPRTKTQSLSYDFVVIIDSFIHIDIRLARNARISSIGLRYEGLAVTVIEYVRGEW